MVLSRTGHRQPDTITSTFMVVPMSATRMKIGTSTGGGMARRNSSTGSRAAPQAARGPDQHPEGDPGHGGQGEPGQQPGHAGQHVVDNRCGPMLGARRGTAGKDQGRSGLAVMGASSNGGEVGPG
jgi:hypothetical protein